MEKGNTKNNISFYVVSLIVIAFSFFISLFIENDNQPFMYAGITLVAFLINIEFKNIHRKSGNFLIIYATFSIISCIISFIMFYNFSFQSPKGLHLYGLVITMFIYAVISAYNKILGIDISDYSSDNDEG